MKILIAGSGGTGGYYGGRLAKAGEEIFFIARGEQLARIAQEGLTVRSINGDFNVAVKAGENARNFGCADIILVCVKSYQLAEILELIAINVGDKSLILSLGNGIESEKIIARKFSESSVAGAVAFIASRIEEPGVIRHSAYGHMTIGELDGALSVRIKKAAEIFNQAGIKCRVSEKIRREIYAKMIWNVGFNALCTLTRNSAGRLLSDRRLENMVREAMTEWISVASAEGVELDPAMIEKNIYATKNGGEIIPSMLQDLYAGRKFEIDILNGTVSKLGRKYNLPTPVNDTISALIENFNLNWSADLPGSLRDRD